MITDLRARPRLNTWSSPTMSSKKEWQTAMDNMKREVMDEMQEYFEKMKKLDEKEENLKETMKELVSKEIGEVKKQITEVNKETQENSDKLQEVETMTMDIDKRVEEPTEENERLKILLEAPISTCGGCAKKPSFTGIRYKRKL